MMHRFAGARPTGLGRKTFWIVVAAIVALLACASAVLSQHYGSYPFWEYGTDGMPRPDGTIQQQDAPAPNQRLSHPPPVYTYKATPRPDGSISIYRNGVLWITVANTKTQFLLSDPNGTGHPVIKFDHASGGHGAVPVNIRARGR